MVIAPGEKEGREKPSRGAYPPSEREDYRQHGGKTWHMAHRRFTTPMPVIAACEGEGLSFFGGDGFSWSHIVEGQRKTRGSENVLQILQGEGRREEGASFSECARVDPSVGRKRLVPGCLCDRIGGGEHGNRLKAKATRNNKTRRKNSSVGIFRREARYRLMLDGTEEGVGGTNTGWSVGGGGVFAGATNLTRLLSGRRRLNKRLPEK